MEGNCYPVKHYYFGGGKNLKECERRWLWCVRFHTPSIRNLPRAIGQIIINSTLLLCKTNAGFTWRGAC